MEGLQEGVLSSVQWTHPMPLAFSTFDFKNKKFCTISKPELKLHVDGGGVYFKDQKRYTLGLTHLWS